MPFSHSLSLCFSEIRFSLFRFYCGECRFRRSGGLFVCSRRFPANPAALHRFPAVFLRFSAHKIRNAAALLVLPAAHFGDSSATTANFNVNRNIQSSNRVVLSLPF